MGRPGNSNHSLSWKAIRGRGYQRVRACCRGERGADTEAEAKALVMYGAGGGHQYETKTTNQTLKLGSHDSNMEPACLNFSCPCSTIVSPIQIWIQINKFGSKFENLDQNEKLRIYGVGKQPVRSKIGSAIGLQRRKRWASDRR